MGGNRKPKPVLGKLKPGGNSGNGKPEKATKSESSEDDSDDGNDGEKWKEEEGKRQQEKLSSKIKLTR